MNPNGTHPSLLTNDDIHFETAITEGVTDIMEISITECPICFVTNVVGCDCHLGDPESDSSGSEDYGSEMSETDD